MNRRLATKSDLADIITSGGGTFSSSSNEILTSSYINNLSSDSIGGTLTLTYSVESTDRSSYLSNECVLYEDITFTKESGPVIEPVYYVRTTPYMFIINTEEWQYFQVESYYQDSEGVKTIMPINVDLSDIGDTSWFTIERYEANDKDLEYGYKVKATGEVSETKQVTIYLKQQDENGKSDWITLTQYAPEVVIHTITYKASTGVSGSNVTEEVEENSIYTPTVPNSFILQSGYQEPMVCTPSEAFTVTEDTEILVSATEIPKPKEYDFAFYTDYDVDDEGNTNWIGYIGEEKTVYINHTIDDYYHEIKICSKEVLDSDWRFIEYTHNDIPNWISITDSDGGISIKTAENNTNTERSFDVIFTQNESGKTIVLHVIQIAYDGILLYNFDHMILKYTWSDTDGTDLDNATYLGYIKNDGTEVLYKPVGYGQTEDTSDPVQNKYLIYGGDNVNSGDEGAYINFREFITNIIEPLNSKNRNIKAIVCKTRSNWFKSKNEGTFDLEFKTYEGGTISKDGFSFINNGGTLVSNYNKQGLNCYATGEVNYKAPNKWYTKMVTITYDFDLKYASLSFDQTDNDGNEDYGFYYDTYILKSFTHNINENTTEYTDSFSYQKHSWYCEFRALDLDIERNGVVNIEIECSGHVGQELRYLTDPSMLKNNSVYPWTSLQLVDNIITGYYELSKLNSNTSVCYKYIEVGPYRIDVNFGVAEQQQAILSLKGLTNDSDKPNYQNSSSDLFTYFYPYVGNGSYFTVKQSGSTITINVESKDAEGNKSPITISNVDDGLDISFVELNEEEYDYKIEIVVPENLLNTEVIYKFTVSNAEDISNRYAITQRGTSFYFIETKPFEEWNNGAYYTESVMNSYDILITDSQFIGVAHDRYLTSFENGELGGELFIEPSSDSGDSDALQLIKDGNHFNINVTSVNDTTRDRYAYYDIYQKNGSGDKINIRKIEIRQYHK